MQTSDIMTRKRSKFEICNRCGEKIKAENTHDHWKYNCRGWYILVSDDETVKIMSRGEKVHLIIKGLPKIDMEKVQKVSPLKITIKDGKITTNFSEGEDDVEKEDTQLTEESDGTGEKINLGGNDNDEESSIDSERRAGLDNDNGRAAEDRV